LSSGCPAGDPEDALREVDRLMALVAGSVSDSRVLSLIGLFPKQASQVRGCSRWPQPSR
jgi:hypothetical protein